MSNGRRKIRFGLWYDFRNPAQWRQPADRLYREILDQIAWGENNGFDDVWLSEHHFIEDGYLPSILPAAAAIAARTNRIRIASGVLLMPFHNPIRLAEDIATVDVISGGRFELGVGIGFKQEEFTGFGVSSKERGARTDQSLDIIRRALAGETVTFKSDFFDFQNVRVTPEPIQQPHPPIWLGGFTPAALRRAVRFGDGFTVPGANRDVYDRYVAELKKENRPTDDLRFASGFWFLIVSEDPEKTFAEAADHVIYQVNDYSVWLQAGGLQPLAPRLDDREALKAKRIAAGGRPRYRNTDDPQLGRHRADHPLLLLDLATGAAATLGADAPGAVRLEGDPCVSLTFDASLGITGASGCGVIRLDEVADWQRPRNIVCGNASCALLHTSRLADDVICVWLVGGYRCGPFHRGDPHAYPPNRGFGRVRRRARRSAGRECRGAILSSLSSPVLAVSAVLAVLRGGRRNRYRRVGRRRAVRGADGAALLLRLLRAALLPAAALLRAGIPGAAELLRAALRIAPAGSRVRITSRMVGRVRSAMPVGRCRAREGRAWRRSVAMTGAGYARVAGGLS